MAIWHDLIKPGNSWNSQHIHFPQPPSLPSVSYCDKSSGDLLFSTPGMPHKHGRISLCQMRPFWHGNDWEAAIIAIHCHKTLDFTFNPSICTLDAVSCQDHKACNAAHHAIIDHGDLRSNPPPPLNFTCNEWDMATYTVLGPNPLHPATLSTVSCNVWAIGASRIKD